MLQKKFQKTFSWTSSYPSHSAHSVQIVFPSANASHTWTSFSIPGVFIIASWVLLPMAIFVLAILRGVI